MSIIANIDALLVRQGKTGSDLCKALGLSSGVYSQWKSGAKNPAKKRYVAIADYLGVTVDELIAGADGQAATTGGTNVLSPSIHLATPSNEADIPDDVSNMAAAFALAMQQQKKSEQQLPPELKEAREILDKLDDNKLNAALLMLRGLLNK